MRTEKNTLVPMNENKMSPGLCDARDFVVMEAGESAAPKMPTPFHGQCGDTDAEYRKLLREGEAAANASNFEDTELHPDVNRPGEPHTDGFSRDEK